MLRRRAPRPVDISAALLTLRHQPAEPAELAVAADAEAARERLLHREDLVGDVWEHTGPTTLVAVSDVAGTVSAPPEKGLLLYRLTRAFRPSVVCEFGTGLGVSAAYLCAALHDNGTGRLRTLEASPSRSAVAAGLLTEQGLGLADTFTGLFDDHLPLLDGADLFFLDGNHYAAPTLRYVDAALARMHRPALLVLDDIAGYSREMDQVWKTLSTSDRFTESGAVGDLGVLRAG